MSGPHHTIKQSQHLQDQQSMNSDDPKNSNPSNSQTHRDTSQVPVSLPPTIDNTPAFVETHQTSPGRRSRSTPAIFVLERRSITSTPRQESSQVYTHNPHTTTSTSNTTVESSEHRQGRSLVARHHPRSSSSQPSRTALTPYTLPTPSSSAHSQVRPVTMSSASTPSNTSTAGSGSGSNPSYQLPYAPFPYPAPANAGQGGKGNGK